MERRPSGLWTWQPVRLLVPSAVSWLGVRWVVRRPSWGDAPKEPIRDLRLLLSEWATSEAKLEALERTVDRIRWTPRRMRVRRAPACGAAQLEAGSVEAVKRRELRPAVYVVLAHRARPQAHRFGRSWATKVGGRMGRIRPDRLPLPLFWRWFCDEVRKAAEASLLGEAYPSETSRHARRGLGIWSSTRSTADYADPQADPLERIVEAERRRDEAAWWQTAVATATPTQRQLLRALLDLADTREASQAPSLAAAAGRIGMAPSTARVQWQRLVRRVRLRHDHTRDPGDAERTPGTDTRAGR